MYSCLLKNCTLSPFCSVFDSPLRVLYLAPLLSMGARIELIAFSCLESSNSGCHCLLFLIERQMLGLATLFPEGKVCSCLLKIAKSNNVVSLLFWCICMMLGTKVLKIAKSKQRGVAALLVYLYNARYQSVKIAKSKQLGVAALLVYLYDARYQRGFYIIYVGNKKNNYAGSKTWRRQ